mgnify:FL=1
MSRAVKILGILVATAIAVAIFAAIVFVLVFDPNDYKEQIAVQVEAQTGRTLAIEGDIGLSVFPWLGLQVGPTSLSNAPGFSDRPFAQVQGVEVRVKLMPLLRKELQMDTVVLEGLSLSLETDAAGKTNWADPAGAGAEAEAQPEQPAPEEAGKLALAGLAIGGVEITDAALLWDDRKTNAQYRVDQVNLKTGAIAPGEAVPVSLQLQLAASEPEIAGPVEFSGTLALSADNQVIQIDDAQLSTDLSGAGLPGGALKSQLGFNTRVDLAAETLDVTELALAALGLTIEGGLNGKQILGDAAAFGGELRIKEFVPRELIEALGQPVPEVSDPKVLSRADGQLQLAATKDSLAVPKLQFRLDDSTLNGDLKVSNFAKPAIRFALHLDDIDVDRYLPPQSEQPAPVPPTTAAAAGAQMIPVETLRGLNVNGKLTIDRLKAAQLRSTDIVIQLAAKDGLVRVHPASAKMYQGQYQGDVSLDVRGKQPKISLNEKLAGVQVGPLLQDMLGEARLSGTTQASAQLTALGQTPDEFKQTLNGNLAFAFTDGAVQGFNLAAMIRKAQAQLKGQPLPSESEPNQTDFSELTGSATVTNGVIRNQDLAAKSPLLRVEGKGSVDLPKEALDYLVTAKVTGSLQGQGGKGLEDVRGVAIPVQVAGTFTEPSYKIRLDEALREVAEDKVKEKVQEKVEEKLEKQFGDSLKGLFNR